MILDYVIIATNACHFTFSSRLLCGLRVSTQFEPEYIVVVNAYYPAGEYETKKTYSAKGKVPNWNQTIEFDVTNRSVTSHESFSTFSKCSNRRKRRDLSVASSYLKYL